MVERELAAAGLVAGAVAQVGVRVRPHVRRAAAHRPACAQLRGLLGGAERKNGWQRAEEAAARPPRAIQRGLDRSVWDADAVRDERRAAVMAALGAPDGVLVVDEPGFLKQGTQSAAVPRQHSGTAGRIANGQIGVFLGSASSTGRAGRDRALYLPQEWADDPDRRAVAGIPAAGRFQPTPQPALRMLERARDTGGPAAWVTAAAGYGNASAFRAALAARGQAQVLAVQRPHTTSTWPPSAPLRPVQVAAVAAAIADEGWRRLRCGAGAHGERISAWAFVPPRPARRAGWVLALLGRRQPTRPEELAYDLVQPAPATPLTEVVRAAAPRWIIEDSFTRAKGQGGLDHDAVRSWQGWQRHITPARWALAILAAAAARANGGPPPPPAASSPVASPNCAA